MFFFILSRTGATHNRVLCQLIIDMKNIVLSQTNAYPVMIILCDAILCRQKLFCVQSRRLNPSIKRLNDENRTI